MLQQHQHSTPPQQRKEELQQQRSVMQPHQYRQPRRRDLIFHCFKTMRMVWEVLWDRRVSLLRKGAFLGGLSLLLVLLLFPEVLVDSATFLTPLFSLLGVELPVEGGIDWLAFALASFSLLKVFPTDITGEHYERIFRR